MNGKPQPLPVPEREAALDTPIGRIGLRWREDVVTRVVLDPQDPMGLNAVPDWIAMQIGAYFRSPEFRFSLATEPAGTPFQRQVWQAIAAIPAGRTRTYGALAAELGSAPRAVGAACRANPYPLLVPCHRVVGVHGLGGFAGDSQGRLLGVKRWLLAHEGAALTA